MKNRKFDVLVTHANCSDGITCALLAKEYNNSKSRDLKIIFAKYGNENHIIDSIPNGSDVLFTDFTMSLEGMCSVEIKAKSIVVLDHHKTAEAVLKDKPYAIFNMDKCGAVLTHEWLYGANTDIPKMVQYICDRDLWKFKHQETKEFSAGFKTYKAKELLDMPEKVLRGMSFTNECIKKGSVLIDSQITKTESITTRTNDSQTITFITPEGKHRMWCINNSEYISETGNELSLKQRDDGLVYNASVQYFITDTDIVFSFRSVEDVDVSAIATAFSGGGHPKAAGMSIPLEKFIFKDGFKKLLIDKVLDYQDFTEAKPEEKHAFYINEIETHKIGNLVINNDIIDFDPRKLMYIINGVFDAARVNNYSEKSYNSKTEMILCNKVNMYRAIKAHSYYMTNLPSDIHEEAVYANEELEDIFKGLEIILEKNKFNYYSIITSNDDQFNFLDYITGESTLDNIKKYIKEDENG